MNTKAQRLEGKQTQTVRFLVAFALSLARLDRLSHPNTHSNTHTHAYRPSMSSSPACVDKYMCVRVCPLRVDHNAQLARRERLECVSVVRSGAPSLSTFSTIQVLSAFSSSCPPLFLMLPSSLLVTFWHVHPSVCRVCPDTGPSQVSPNANIQTHAIRCRNVREKELPRTADRHALKM